MPFGIEIEKLIGDIFLSNRQVSILEMSMKSVIALILVLNLIEALALEVQVSGMNNVQDFESRFDLVSPHPQKVVLDCQSFVQGLFFGPVGEEEIIMLEEWECEELMGDMKKTIDQKEKHCLEVDFDRSVLDQQKSCK